MAPGVVRVNYVDLDSGLTAKGEQCPQGAAVKKFLSLVYGLAAYLLFLGTFIYAIGFVGNIGVPKSLDGTATGPWFRSCLIDLGLLSLFALQHSGMARMAFKKQIRQVISPTIERFDLRVCQQYRALSGDHALAAARRRGLERSA